MKSEPFMIRQIWPICLGDKFLKGWVGVDKLIESRYRKRVAPTQENGQTRTETDKDAVRYRRVVLLLETAEDGNGAQVIGVAGPKQFLAGSVDVGVIVESKISSMFAFQ